MTTEIKTERDLLRHLVEFMKLYADDEVTLKTAIAKLKWPRADTWLALAEEILACHAELIEALECDCCKAGICSAHQPLEGQVEALRQRAESAEAELSLARTTAEAALRRAEKAENERDELKAKLEKAEIDGGYAAQVAYEREANLKTENDRLTQLTKECLVARQPSLKAALERVAMAFTVYCKAVRYNDAYWLFAMCADGSGRILPYDAVDYSRCDKDISFNDVDEAAAILEPPDPRAQALEYLAEIEKIYWHKDSKVPSKLAAIRAALEAKQ